MNTTTITFRMQRVGTDDVATFELSGSDLFVNGIIPSISSFGVVAAATFLQRSSERMRVHVELSNALEAVMANQAYAGEFVTVTRSEPARSNETDESGTPNGTAISVQSTKGD